MNNARVAASEDSYSMVNGSFASFCVLINGAWTEGLTTRTRQQRGWAFEADEQPERVQYGSRARSPAPDPWLWGLYAHHGVCTLIKIGIAEILDVFTPNRPHHSRISTNLWCCRRSYTICQRRDAYCSRNQQHLFDLWSHQDRWDDNELSLNRVTRTNFDRNDISHPRTRPVSPDS